MNWECISSGERDIENYFYYCRDCMGETIREKGSRLRIVIAETLVIGEAIIISP